MQPRAINWWEGVVLWRSSTQPWGNPVALFRGQIVDAIHCALSRASHEHARLSLTFDRTRERIGWDEISELASRRDFPALI